VRTLAAILACAAAALGGGVARAGEAPTFTAREGCDLARDAALAWSDDAELVWIESDEAVGEAGAAERWGYLFYSPGRDAARGYSVRDGRIRVAHDLGFAFPAPPIQAEWIDSGRALAAAEEAEGESFRAEHGGRVRSMLLVRGLLNAQDPGVVTWAVVYESASAPGLWVVVDARTGEVVRTWRG
jgi:hypothetical protein